MKWNQQHLDNLKNSGKIKNYQINKHPVRHPGGKPIQTNRDQGSVALEWLRFNLGYWSNDHALQMEEEYRFHRERRYRFDFAWPAIKVALEFEGGLFAPNGGHNSVTGIHRDIEKYELAESLGWKVIRVTAMTYKTAPQKLNERLL